MKLKKHSKYFLFAIFVLLLIGSFLIIRPFIGAILTSLVLGYIFYPIYRKLNSWLKRPNLSALIMVFLLLIIIFVPMLLFFNMLLTEVIGWYSSFQITDMSSFFAETLNMELTPVMEEKIASVLEQGTEYLFLEASNFVLSLPAKIISVVIMLFVLFFVFREGRTIVDTFKKSLPIEDSHKHRVFTKVESTINSLVYGEIVISIVEGLVAILGFWLLGIPSPVLWGSVVAVVALLPAIGPLVVWLPMAAIKFLQGDTVMGIAITLFGLIILTIFLDMIVKPKVLGYKGHIHPIVILLGVLGGLGLFGLTGLILGPVILVLLILVVDIYIKEGIK